VTVRRFGEIGERRRAGSRLAGTPARCKLRRCKMAQKRRETWQCREPDIDERVLTSACPT